MKTILIICFLAIGQTTNAQHHFSVSADFGVSKLLWDIITPGFVPSGNVGVQYKYQKDSAKSRITTEFLVVQSGGLFKSELNYTDEFGNPYATTTSRIFYNITSVNLPIYYGLQFGRIGLSIGGEATFPIYSNYISRYKDPVSLETVEHSESPLYLNPVNINGVFLFDFQLRNKIALRSSYRHSINKITKDQGAEWRLMQITVGVSYKIAIKD